MDFNASDVVVAASNTHFIDMQQGEKSTNRSAHKVHQTVDCALRFDLTR